jgi:hypothetical protein
MTLCRPRGEPGGARQWACTFAGVQFVQNVPIAQPPSFLLPPARGEDRGEGFNGLNDLNVLNAMRQ